MLLPCMSSVVVSGGPCLVLESSQAMHPGSFPSLKSKILHALRSQIPSLLLCTNTYLNSESSVRTSGCVLGDIC